MKIFVAMLLAIAATSLAGAGPARAGLGGEGTFDMKIPMIDVEPLAADADITPDLADPAEDDSPLPQTLTAFPDLQFLVERAAEDLAQLDEKIAAREIHNFARAAMDRGKPGLFRDFLAAYVDPNWKNLPDDLATLNIIAWMPDTGEFLEARIEAARYIGRNGELDTGDLEYLWKDLRARVERVGNPDLFAELIGGMAETGYARLAARSLDRYLSSNTEKLQILTQILLDPRRDLEEDARLALLGRIDGLIEEHPEMRYDISDLAFLYWQSGRHDDAQRIVDAETDPVLRLRIGFRLLLAE